MEDSSAKVDSIQSDEELLSSEERSTTTKKHSRKSKENKSKCNKTGVDRTLLVYKVFYFLFFSGFGSTFPYLSIYFKQLGLSATYVGTLSGIRPLIQFFSGPLWAYVADKYRARRLVLCMSVVAWLVFTLALAIPQPSKTKCESINVTYIAKRDLSHLVHQGLPLSPVPAIPRAFKSTDKKSTIAESSRYASKTKRVIVHDPAEMRYLFHIFLVLIVVGEFFEAPSFIMIDTALIQQLQNKCHDYGRTRLFGSIGYGLASFGVGAVLDTTIYVYCDHNMTNYMVIFYFFIVFIIIGLIIVLTAFTFKYNDDSSGSLASIISVYQMCCTPKYASFLLIVWYMGVSNGTQVTFLNWYLEELGVSKIMMGFATCLRSGAVVVGFFFSGSLLNRIDELVVVFFCLLVFVVIFFGYSVMVNQWLMIPLEILQGGVYAISWSTCIVYLSSVTPDDGAATMQSILQGIYWGLGTGTGAIIGGVLINNFGLVWTYRAGGITTLIVTVSFVITQLVIKKFESKDDVKNIEKENP